LGIAALMIGTQLLGSGRSPANEADDVVAEPVQPVKAAWLPLVSSKHTVVLGDVEVPVRGSVSAVGVTRGGSIVVSDAAGDNGLGRALIFSTEGARVFTAHRVVGIAIADRTSDIVSGVEADRGAEPGGESRAVIFDASARTQPARTRVPGRAKVMAVAGSSAFLSDGDASWTWPAGGALERLPYVPDDTYVMDASEEFLVAVTPGIAATVFDRTTGRERATLEAVVGAAIGDDDAIAGLAPGATVSTYQVGNGTTSSIDFPGAMSVGWGPAGQVIVIAAPGGRRLVAHSCAASLQSCTKVDMPGKTLMPALPADGLTQILTGSA